ncbi:MAG: glutamate--cysteine ligase [Alphaproteobacteria bacterium]|nr:glutamate--cysteine ligase [Alphaproteobacteria bacterium]
MSTRQNTQQGEPIGSRDELVQWIAEGEKPTADWRLGTEHEKFVFKQDSFEPVPYDGETGISALMQGLMGCCGWEPIIEQSNIIGLKRAFGQPGANVSLEPGGQFELSGAPLETIHETAAETDEHLRQCHRAGGPLGLSFMGLGASPMWSLKETPKVPKQRYGIMTQYMPKVGSMGLEMMYRTATIQVNLDFGDEADMTQKMRIALALQPVATALFASSPFTEGKPNGFKSLRSEIWRFTDPDRTGMLPFVFEDGMGYERLVDYALDVPMYFVYRDGRYIDAAGSCFRDFLAGRLPGLPGEIPTIDDWSDHVTTLFPEVRVKRFIEMRGADGGRADMIAALPALWAGLLYDGASREAAWDLVKDWTQTERQALRDEVPRLALQTPFRGGVLLDVARQVVAIAADGLKARDRINSAGEDERIFLAPLEDIVESGMTNADRYLEKFHGSWKGRIEPIFAEASL